MKKFLLAAAFGVLGSSLSFGAACASGNSYNAAVGLGVGGCTFTDNGNTWLINNFQTLNSTSSGYGANETATQIGLDLKVNFIGVSGGISGVDGVYLAADALKSGVFVQFTYTPTVQNSLVPALAANQFIATTGPGLSQQASFQTSFSFLGVQTAPAFTTVFGVIDGYRNYLCTNGLGFNNCAIGGAGNTTVNSGDGASLTKNYTGGTVGSLTPTDSATFDARYQSAANSGFYAITDNFQLRPGSVPNGGTSADTSTSTINFYGNGQYITLPSSGIPEPMTMGLMGAGLLALGLMRRFRA